MNELIIKSSSQEVSIALLKDGKLVELHREKSNNSFAVGDIYLGRVKKIITGLNAVFVDIGSEKDAFLHYHDLGPKLLSFQNYTSKSILGKQKNWLLSDFKFDKEILKEGAISSAVSTNQNILVQITKEAISSKGPRISSEISIAGRYLVLVPFSDKVSVSQKITDLNERDRLKRLIQSIKPKGFGVIVRTVAMKKKVADLDSDLNNMISKWKLINKNLRNSKSPKKILGELGKVSVILRDILNDSFNKITVDNKEIFHQILSYLRTIAPDKEKILKLFKSDLPIFEKFNVEKQIKSSFGKTVSIKKGAYLVIEHTEALHVIDVNSGNRNNKSDSQEDNALEVNLEAAKEIARQLRLRDMGGIIVVDFIDLNDSKNRIKLFDSLKLYMSEDRAKHKILPPSKFGLIEITRQRQKPELKINTNEKCPTCKDKGEVNPLILLIDKILSSLDEKLLTNNKNSLTIYSHPFVSSHLKEKLYYKKFLWFFKYFKILKFKPLHGNNFFEYSIK